MRLSVNIAMLMLMISALAFRMTGDFLHEWIGVAAILLFILHNIINIKWYGHVFSGKYTILRAINLVINSGVTISAAIMLISGLMHSRHVLWFMNLQGSIELRQIHTTAAYWLLLFTSMHLGMYWKSILFRLGFYKMENKICKNLLRIFCVFIALCGVYFLFQRDMFSKLFLGYSFDFWDPELPIFLFYFANLSIALLCTLAMYIIAKYFMGQHVE